MYFQHNIWNRFSDVWTRRRKLFDIMRIDFLNIFLFTFWVTVMLLTSWWLVTSSKCWPRRQCKKILGVGDQKGQNRHRHLREVSNTFRPQHPSPTSMSPTFRVYIMVKRSKLLSWNINEQLDCENLTKKKPRVNKTYVTHCFVSHQQVLRY